MFETQQGTAAQAAPAAPVSQQTPPPPPGGAVVVGTPQAPAAPTTGIDLSAFSANQLRRMLQELRSQRAELADRRSTIGETYERATGDSRQGIGERILTLDRNIVSYELEIARVGRELATKSGGEQVQPQPSGNPGPGWVRDDDAAGMAFGFSVATGVLVFFFMKRFFRRKYGRMPSQPQQQNMIQGNERLDRIEQAVDTIAVEIERVSENQRFMTRLMTETQLGDTIKDVRKSAELAKSAAESSG
jgi:hypothetical protein